MLRKNYFTFLLTAFLLLAGSLAAFAQAPVNGKVVMTKSDGTTVPVADAVVEPFRTDIKGKSSPAKTNKKGEFNFVGLQLGGTFALAVSAPNAAPTYLPNVKAGQTDLVITLSEGDGKRLTEDEVRSALSSQSATSTASKTETKMTPEQIKKAMEERAKLEAEYAENKKKVENQNAVVGVSLKEGNDAFNAKNYDLAIAKYTEGVNAAPDFVGSAPVLLNNKGTALKTRAVGFYNQAVTAPDATAKLESYTKAMKDFSDALDAYNTSWNISKNAPAADIKDQTTYQANKATALNGFKDLLKVMVQTERVNPEKTATIATLFGEYMTFETDAAKKAEAQTYLADVYRILGDSEKAIAEYKKVLATSPDNPDALAGLGLSLANAGYNTDGTINMPMMQESITNLQRFADVAPANHKLKTSVTETVAYLKTLNVKPVKAEKPAKKKN
jgi:tetratricopeptide (TPR) repeat protein